MTGLNNWLRDRTVDTLGTVQTLPAIFRAMIGAIAAPLAKAGEPDSWLKRSSEGLSVAACSLLIVVLVIFDFVQAPRVSFALFYLILVAISAWNGGRKAGIGVALACSLATFLHDTNVSKDVSLGQAIWNLSVQIGIYLFAALLVSAVRGLTENLERRVRERTAALELEIKDRKQTEEQLRKTMQQLRQLAENIADAFWMRNAEETRMVYASPAYEKIWGRSCKELYQLPNAWLEAIHAEDRERVAHAMQTKQSAGEYNQEYRIVRPDSTLRWIRDRAFPIRDSSGKVIRIVGIAEDITERRQLERQILEISDREQARMGQDLHDGLCQKLVSIAFDNDSLEQKLAARELPETQTTRAIAALLDDVITEARALSRGLFPVQLETDGLGLALQQLAASVRSRFKVDCDVDCPQVVQVRDNAAATHLYRIAQEAANNAIKHGKVSSISIQLIVTGDQVRLTVSDDGIGIPLPLSSTGMGLHIMEYRARNIGGTLSIERGASGGTVVSCLAPQQSI
jgi:PAS domain S-box-containing protein